MHTSDSNHCFKFQIENYYLKEILNPQLHFNETSSEDTMKTWLSAKILQLINSLGLL